MSVLQRKELEESPLADLHAIASELAIEGYRGLRRDALVAAIVDAQGGEADGPGDVDEGADDAFEAEPGAQGPEATGDEGADEAAEATGDEGIDEATDAEAVEQRPSETVTGVLDILHGGSGFVRPVDGDDVYVSPAQIRRCELRAGDEVSGPLRPARRNERHPSLVHVEGVNGGPAEPPEQRPLFDDLQPVHPSERLSLPAALDSVPVGMGSRVAIAGGPGAGATRLLRDVAAALAGASGEISVSAVLVGARPEEVTDWTRDSGVSVTGGSFDASLEAQTQAAELAVERAKRVAERGGDAVVLIDSLEPLAAAAAGRIFGAARKLEEGGSLTVIAATGMTWEAQRQASTRIGLDPPGPGGEPQVSTLRSGTLRADLLRASPAAEG